MCPSIFGNNYDFFGKSRKFKKILRYDESGFDMDEDEQDELGKKFGLPVDQGGSKHSTRSVGRKNKKSRKKNPRKKQKKTKPGRKNKHRRPKRTSCSKDRLFLNFKELGWDVSIFQFNYRHETV